TRPLHVLPYESYHYLLTGALPTYFFFQAEDGIRDRNVTGVQTCALPISPNHFASYSIIHWTSLSVPSVSSSTILCLSYMFSFIRSEERRVGKECRSRRWTGQSKEKGCNGDKTT